jgi:hypothetical protein
MRFSPSTIIPSEFRYFDSYDLGGNQPGEIPFNTAACSRFIEARPVENYVALGKCCVCGTQFRYGEAWEHEPTGLRISIGHVCAEKYGLMADDAEYRGKRAKAIAAAQRKQKLYEIGHEVIMFIMLHPEIRVWLSLDHHITRDLKANLYRWGSLTTKQVALLKKLYDDAQIERVEFRPVAIPSTILGGRVRIEGTVVGIKWVEGYGYHAADVIKMIVRVEHAGGAYKVYGTMPEVLSSAIMELRNTDADEYEDLRQIVRRTQPVVAFTAKFEVSRDDAAFGFFKRPTKAELLQEVAA